MTESTAAIRITIGNNPAGGVLAGEMVRSAAAGLSYFSGLSIDRAGTGYTLVARSPGLASATSNPFSISSTAGLAGRYNSVEFFHDYPAANGGQELETEAGYATISAGGSVQFITEINSWGESPADASSAVKLDARGRIVLDGAQSYGMVTPNLGLILLPDTDPLEGQDLGLSFGIRARAGIELGEITGRYNTVAFYHESPVVEGWEIEVEAGYALFGDLGSASFYVEANSRGDVVAPDTSEYGWIDSNGRIVVGGNQTFAAVSPNAEVIIVPDLDPAESGDLGIAFLVRSSSTLDKSALRGRYNMVSFFHDTPAMNGAELETEAGFAYFDGDGNWVGETSFTLEGDESAPESGTYDIDATGHLIIDGKLTYGMVSPSGDVVIVPDLDQDEEQDVGVTFLFRAPEPTRGSVPTAFIHVDGDVADWAGLSPMVTDSQGDSIAGGDSTDIRALWLATDGFFLYYRIDYEKSPSSVYTHHLHVSDTGNSDRPVDGDYETGMSLSHHWLSEFIGGLPATVRTESLAGIGSKTVEGRIRLVDIDYSPGAMVRVTAYSLDSSSPLDITADLNILWP